MIAVEKIESGIIVYRWIGNVDMQDAKSVLKTLSVISPTTYRFSEQWDEALHMARTLLEQKD